MYSHLYFTHQDSPSSAAKTTKPADKKEEDKVKKGDEKPVTAKKGEDKKDKKKAKNNDLSDDGEQSKSALFSKEGKANGKAHINGGKENGKAREESSDSDVPQVKSYHSAGHNDNNEDDSDDDDGILLPQLLPRKKEEEHEAEEQEEHEEVEQEKYLVREIGEKRAETVAGPLAEIVAVGVRGPCVPLSEEKESSILSFLSLQRKVSRYYGEREKVGKCHNCGAQGHYLSDCPEPLKERQCYVCAMRGHNSRECPNELCFNCMHLGHRSTVWTTESNTSGL